MAEEVLSEGLMLSKRNMRCRKEHFFHAALLQSHRSVFLLKLFTSIDEVKS